MLVLFGALLLSVSALTTGCSSASVIGSNSGTPAGTYTVLVTGTSGTTTGSASLTVMVQ
jgi:hypothetical protein